MKMDPCFTPYVVISFKCIEDLNMKYTIIKLFKRNVEEYLHVLEERKEFIKQDTKITAP